MIISLNSDPKNAEFESLLAKSVIALKDNSEQNPTRYAELLGNRLEDEVYDILTEYAKKTPFEGSIELISGQRFPDIIAKKYGSLGMVVLRVQSEPSSRRDIC